MNKLIISALLIFGLVGMIGTATADQLNIYDSGTTNAVINIDLVPGGPPVVKDLVASAFIQGTGTQHNLSDSVIVSTNTGGALSNNIVIEYLEITPLGSWGTENYSWTQNANAGGSELLNIRFSAVTNAPVGSVYQIQIMDSVTGNIYPATLTITSTTIPEFPTIALPIAGILGLMFIISSRKKKE